MPPRANSQTDMEVNRDPELLDEVGVSRMGFEIIRGKEGSAVVWYAPLLWAVNRSVEGHAERVRVDLFARIR